MFTPEFGLNEEKTRKACSHMYVEDGVGVLLWLKQGKVGTAEATNEFNQKLFSSILLSL